MDVRAAAEAAGVSLRCARKWVARYRAQDEAGLHDRSSAPHRVWNRTPAERIDAIEALRRLRFTAAEIAEVLGMALSTVSGLLTRSGMGRLGRLGLEPPVRYERSRPASSSTSTSRSSVGSRAAPANASATASGSTTRPPRTDRAGIRRGTVGWECVHIAVDDYSRLAYAEVLPDEKAVTAAAFLRRAVAFYKRHGIQVEWILNDNGACYQGVIHALACRQLGIRHSRTRPYRPQTNGKAGRFIRTLLSGWAYAAIYRSSSERTAALDGWLWNYNHQQRHSALGHQPPIRRTNLLASYT